MEVQAGLNSVLCSGSHAAEIKVSSGRCSFHELGVLLQPGRIDLPEAERLISLPAVGQEPPSALKATLILVT